MWPMATTARCDASAPLLTIVLPVNPEGHLLVVCAPDAAIPFGDCAHAKSAGVNNAFDIPGFVPEYIRPMFCEGRGPFRWVALSGDPEDIRRTDRLVLDIETITLRCGLLSAPLAIGCDSVHRDVRRTIKNLRCLPQLDRAKGYAGVALTIVLSSPKRPFGSS